MLTMQPSIGILHEREMLKGWVILFNRIRSKISASAKREQKNVHRIFWGNFINSNIQWMSVSYLRYINFSRPKGVWVLNYCLCAWDKTPLFGEIGIKLLLWTSLVAPCKESTCQCRRHGFDPWSNKTHLRRKLQYTPVLLPGEFHGQSNLVGYSPWSCKELEVT